MTAGATGDDNGFGLGQLLFGLWMWRESDAGRIDPGCIFEDAGADRGLVLGGAACHRGRSVPRYDGSLDVLHPVCLADRSAGRCPRPDAAADRDRGRHRAPVARACRVTNAERALIPGIGKKVAVGDGWWVRVDKAQAWRPSYWSARRRLVTAYVTVGMPAVEDGPRGRHVLRHGLERRTYTGWIEGDREPHLFDCADYHRRRRPRAGCTFFRLGTACEGLAPTSCAPS